MPQGAAHAFRRGDVAAVLGSGGRARFGFIEPEGRRCGGGFAVGFLYGCGSEAKLKAGDGD